MLVKRVESSLGRGCVTEMLCLMFADDSMACAGTELARMEGVTQGTFSVELTSSLLQSRKGIKS